MIKWDELNMSDMIFDGCYPKTEYPIDEGQNMTIAEWKEACDFGAYVDDDGHGEVFGEVDGLVKSLGYYVPSLRNEIPDNATHIIWYNK